LSDGYLLALDRERLSSPKCRRVGIDMNLSNSGFDFTPRVGGWAGWDLGEIGKRVAKQVANLDRSRELGAMQWTESVSEFDAQ
jgi:hypothetical protein